MLSLALLAGCAWRDTPALDLATLQGAAQEAESGPVALAPPLTLDGQPLGDDEAAIVNARVPVAVMIDNLPGGSRPQYGLDRADVVYEALVEGGITRFMAVYLRRDAERIEPVRSVRTPFLYPAKELGALVAHVGAAETEGMANSARQMREWGVPHLDGDAITTPFRRDGARIAPHNMMTGTTALRAEGESWGAVGPSRAASWLFKDDRGPANVVAGPGVSASYSFAWGGAPVPEFAADWSYDADSNAYLRSMAGRAHVEASTGAQLAFKNVVIQLAPARVVDGEGHVMYDLLGEGRALVLRDGQSVAATWTKRDRADRTRYWDADGDEIRFNRGPTWVVLLLVGSPLTVR